MARIHRGRLRREHLLYLQRGSDISTRELYEMIEADIKDEDGMPAQEAAYLADAEEEADSRNEEESDE